MAFTAGQPRGDRWPGISDRRVEPGEPYCRLYGREHAKHPVYRYEHLAHREPRDYRQADATRPGVHRYRVGAGALYRTPANQHLDRRRKRGDQWTVVGDDATRRLQRYRRGDHGDARTPPGMGIPFRSIQTAREYRT